MHELMRLRRAFTVRQDAVVVTTAIAIACGWACSSHSGTSSSGESANGSSSSGSSPESSGAGEPDDGGSTGPSSGAGALSGDSGASAESKDASVDDAATTDAAGDGACVPDLECKPVPPDSGNYYADCVAQVNQFRACVCEPPIARWTDAEACANEEAQHDEMVDAAHAGFEAKLCSPEGTGECECPGYPSESSIISLCLQQMFDEGPPAAGSFNHFSIMTASTATKVACGIYTDSKGAVWALQNYQE
jgi:hypothetical protein